jgi:hypothetical protein
MVSQTHRLTYVSGLGLTYVSGSEPAGRTAGFFHFLQLTANSYG